MRTIGIITTKNRLDFFKLAIGSAYNQTLPLNELIVVSDSENSVLAKEKSICDNNNAVLLTNQNTHNYAGSLNTALSYIIDSHCIKNRKGIEDIFIAFLDDDDIWHIDYIESCRNAVKDNTDFVVCGLNYCTENGIEPLSIPSKLDIQDFLKGNPHIQGSNTFIRLKTLLMAGMFDENMSSTIDRDLFSRVMMLNPSFEIINKYLVEINAYNNRVRITNGKDKKTDGLAKFYYKYSGFMTDATKEAFFKRASEYFGVEQKGIAEHYRNQHITLSIPNHSSRRYRGNLVIGYIATDYDLGYRLLQQLISLNRPNTKIVILINFTNSVSDYRNKLQQSKYSYLLIEKEEIIANAKTQKYGKYVTLSSVSNDTIQDIAIARTILQTHLHDASDNGDVIWVLDDDMELKELVYQNNGIVERATDIDSIIPEYINTYDAVVGNYSLDAPLPAMSTLRTNLLDYMYTFVGKKNSDIDYAVLFSNDYYYDLTDNENKHLETPLRIDEDCSLKGIFSGKAQARKLFISTDKNSEVKCRGGNTLIFNRELLLIPNISIKLGDNIGRRSDYFWTLLARQRGYKLINAPFALLHNRKSERFDYTKEMHKFFLDIIGSSFTKAIEELGEGAGRHDFYTTFYKISTTRLNKFITSYYRIMGLLKIIGVPAMSYAAEFSEASLNDYIRRFDALLDDTVIMPAYDTLRANVAIYSTMQNRDKICNIIKNHFNLPSLHLLGAGSEALVFSDNNYVYKYFVNKPQNFEFLKQISKCFINNAALYPLTFITIEGYTLIKYKYENSYMYNGGFAIQIAKLISFGKENGFVFTNIKKDNFVVVDGQIKLIDYGKSIVPFDNNIFERSIERAYQLIRYYFLSTEEFKQIITKSYEGEATAINAGLDTFKKLIGTRYKEDLHDNKVIDIIKAHSPQKILDYGAGKCKIANRLGSAYDVSVFDIDTETMKIRADKDVRILNSIDPIADNCFDLINSNLVLCCVNNEAVELIMSNITRLLQAGGHLVVSICNPLFNDVSHTELRTQGLTTDYHTSAIYEKHNNFGAFIRTEYHRPIEFYTCLFQRYGYRIDNIIEGDGIDCDLVLPIAEHIIFDCSLITKPKTLDDVSLLIKTNPMEYKSIYENIRHIVSQLEKGISFAKRIVVVDCDESTIRARKYDDDNLAVLLAELDRLKANGIIDRIVNASISSAIISNTYHKYFRLKSSNPHSANGQGTFATLHGFDYVKTRYVFQTDSDILYYNKSFTAMADFVNAAKASAAVSSSISIAHRQNASPMYGTRIEVRNCLIDLQALNSMLPLRNEIKNGQIQLPWHRALDEKTLDSNKSMRMTSNELFFIHPQNEIKTIPNYLATVRQFVENNCVYDKQYDNVELIGSRSFWHEKATANVVLFIRGYNTPPNKLKRLFDSLRTQTFQNFQIVYIDDSSDNVSCDYAKFVLKYDKAFCGKTVALFNDINIGSLANFDYSMTEIAANPESIIVNIDNDDFLVDEDALNTIFKEFEKDADLSVGGCIRYDKPMKKYVVESFEKPWERGGDNIWLHPKCFKRYLYDKINKNDMKIDGKFVTVNTDFAFMLPLLEVARHPIFINKILYYFEPSIENIQKQGKYNEQITLKMKEILLDRARRKYEKNHFGNR